MAYQLFRLPKAVGLDSAVRALSGAKAYFYETGTTTPQDTYSDAELTTPHAHPVVADASGVFPPIYLDPSRQYKLTLNNSADVLIYTVDPVNDRHGVSYDRTAAEIAAGNDPVSKQYPRNHILRFIPTSEHDAIYAGTSSYDASADAQDWLDSLQPGDEAVLVGVVRAQGLVLTTSDVTFSGGGWLRPISNSSTSAVLTIGSDSPSTMVRRIKGRLRLGGPSDGVSTWSNITGLELKQCVEADIALDFRGLGVGWSGTPSVSAVAYNQWHLGLVLNTKIGVLMNPSSAGYVNENTFWGGRFGLNSGQYEDGCIYIDIRNPTANQPNNNRFVCPSFENTAQYLKIAGTDNSIERARFEPGVSGTPGTDFAETLIELTGSRNYIDISYNSEWLSGNHSIDHGGATRIDDFSFTIAGKDVRDYFYPGALARVTISGTTSVVPVRASSFATDTTVLVASPRITGNPTAVVTARFKNSGSTNAIRVSNLQIPSVAAMSAEVRQDALLWLSRCSMYMTARDANYPALTIGPGGSSSDYALMVSDFDSVNAYLQCNGSFGCERFSLGGGTPRQRQSAITAPSGGTTQDAEARTAINSIITVLELFGFVTPN